MEKKAPGKGFLKGVGILLIIGGVFGFIGAASNAFVASALSSGSLDSATTAIYEQAGLTAETFQAGIIHICHSGRYLPGSRNFRCGKLQQD